MGITEELGRCGTAGAELFPFITKVVRLEVDLFCLTDLGGVELPWSKLRVEDDMVVGTVPLDSLEPLEESEVRKLALERLRKSLKKGMTADGISRDHSSLISISGAIARQGQTLNDADLTVLAERSLCRQIRNVMCRLKSSEPALGSEGSSLGRNVDSKGWNE